MKKIEENKIDELAIKGSKLIFGKAVDEVIERAKKMGMVEDREDGFFIDLPTDESEHPFFEDIKPAHYDEEEIDIKEVTPLHELGIILDSDEDELLPNRWAVLSPEEIDALLPHDNTNSTFVEEIEDMIENTEDIISRDDKLQHEKMVFKPQHYQILFDDGVAKEVLDVIKAISTKEEYTGAMKFQVLKYSMRADKKGAIIQDLKKARFYLDEWIKIIGTNERSWKDLKDHVEELAHQAIKGER